MKQWLARAHRHLRKVQETSKLPMALGLAILFALIVTIVGVSIYSADGISRLDLSRPGYERERSEVASTPTQAAYDTTSPITRSAIDDFLREYDGRTKDLGQYGDFRDTVMDDANLQLSAN